MRQPPDGGCRTVYSFFDIIRGSYAKCLYNGLFRHRPKFIYIIFRFTSVKLCYIYHIIFKQFGDFFYILINEYPDSLYIFIKKFFQFKSLFG